MTDINNNVKTVCSFYASEWHLVTMLLPNIDRRINKGNKITTILEMNLENNMETLLQKLNLENEQEILNIKWGKSNLKNIEKLVENNDCIIIAGTVEYIKHVNALIEEVISNDKIITIIDCYDINECEPNIKQILDEHESILNTAGESEKEKYITTMRMEN